MAVVPWEDPEQAAYVHRCAAAATARIIAHREGRGLPYYAAAPVGIWVLIQRSPMGCVFTCAQGVASHAELWLGDCEEGNRLAITAMAADSAPCAAFFCCALGCGGCLDCCDATVATGSGAGKLVVYQRDVTKECYEYYRLEITPMLRDRVIVWAAAHLGKPFSYYGQWRSWLPCLWRATDGESYFCSETVHAVLKETGCLSHVMPDSYLCDVDSGSVLPDNLRTELLAASLGCPSKVLVTGNHVTGRGSLS